MKRADRDTYGEVPKRPKGADSKSARRVTACVGSNPTLSAIHTDRRSARVVFLLYRRVGVGTLQG